MSIKDFKNNIELKPKNSFFKKRKNRVKDFSWQGTKENPFKKNDNSQKRKVYFYLTIIIFCFFITIFLFIFHPFFKITQIETKGLQRINSVDIKTVTYNVLALKSFIFLPNNSYFKIDLENLEEVIKNRFPIENVKIEKVFPNKLNIIIEEKITTVIYDNGEKYSFINLNGDVVEIFRKVSNYEWQEDYKIVTSTDEFDNIIEKKELFNKEHTPDIQNLIDTIGNYPIVFDMREKNIEINKNVITEKYTKKIIEWYKLLKNSNINLKYFIINNSLNQLIIKTFDGWYIKSNINREVKNQIRELNTVLEQEIKEKYFIYIDLRYKDRIYWK